jgi:hypothetical protein
MLARQRALFRFRDPIADRLAHFLRHDAPEVGCVLLQDLRRTAHRCGSLRETGAAPFEKGVVRLRHDRAHVSRRQLVVLLQDFTRCRVDRLDAHRGATPM